MRTLLAWRNLLHHKVRTTLAVMGVSLAVVLMFMQLGFLGAVQATATIVYDALDFDLVIRSPNYLHLADARSFPRDRLAQAAGCEQVESIAPLYADVTQWRNPRDGSPRAILALGVSPESRVFTLPEIDRQRRPLHVDQFVLIDRRSRREFGPADGKRFGDGDVGVEAELARSRVRIVGHYSLGSGLAADGAVVMSDRGFARAMPGRSIDEVSLGLVKLTPGTDPDEAAARLRGMLPGDVEVLTRHQVRQFELDRWVNQTSLGVIFQLGVALAMVVGTAIVYQVLASDVARHLPEYATLKALGYRFGYLAGVVLQQALTLAVAGFVPGLIVAVLLYALTSLVANVPVNMTATRVAIVFALTLFMCVVSGWGALRKMRRADPADLF